MLCACISIYAYAGGRHGYITQLLDYNSETDVSGEKNYFADIDQTLFSFLSEECGGGGVDSLTE